MVATVRSGDADPRNTTVDVASPPVVLPDGRRAWPWIFDPADDGPWDRALFRIEAEGRAVHDVELAVENAAAKVIELRIPPQGLTGTFDVVNPDGTPAVGVLVAAVPAAAKGWSHTPVRITTDALGRAAFTDLAECAHKVLALDPETRRAALAESWWPGRENGKLILREPRPLEFRIVLASGSAKGVSVTIQPDPLSLSDQVRTTSDDEGFVRCPPFVHEAFSLRFFHRNGRDFFDKTMRARDVQPGGDVLIEPR